MSREQSFLKKNKRAIIRKVLMLSGILLVAGLSAEAYVKSDRFIDTDNAYIKATKIMVTPQVSGEIIASDIDDNQPIKAGDELFRIDDRPFKIAVENAKAELRVARGQIEHYRAAYRQKVEELARQKIEATYTKEEFERRNALISTGAVTQTDLNESRRDRDKATQTLAVLKEEIKGILAALGGDAEIKVEDHPLYLKATAALENAELNLSRTIVTAPSDGIIVSAPNVGTFARAGMPTINIISAEANWIEANYKETELTRVQVGQPVEIEVDSYPDYHWKGRVESIAPATGSEFALLPAQNSSGNWVKVVQRIAVRIAVDEQPEAPKLRAGMSTHVTIDIGHYPHQLSDLIAFKD